MRGDDERWQARDAFADLLQHFESTHVGQADVENREGEFTARQFVEPAPAAGAEPRLVAEPFADRPQRTGHGVFVFDDEDRFHEKMGSCIVTMAPPCGALPTRSAPWWALRISEETLKPMPMPPSFSEKKRSA